MNQESIHAAAVDKAGRRMTRGKAAGERRNAKGKFLLYFGHKYQSEKGVGVLLSAKA